MLLILSSSKTQQANGRDFPASSQPALLSDSHCLAGSLRNLSVQALCAFMQISPRLGQVTWQRYQDFAQTFTPANASQAIFTFQGDSYSAIASERYDMAELQHAQKHLRILSGLYGILRPLDLMMPYRLEMAAPLATPRGPNLYAFWSEKVTELIVREMRESGEEILIHLASQEYARVIDRKRLGRKMVTVVFQEKKAGSYRIIPFHAKRARGLMAHFVISQGIDKAVELQEFNLDGYIFRSDLSTETEWLFCRDQATPQ